MTVPLNQFTINQLSPTTNDEPTTRIKKLTSELDLTNTPIHARDKLTKLCTDYNDIFALENDLLTTNNFYKQRIALEDKAPVYIKNYRTPETQITEINRQINQMLDNKIIQHSTSPYNSPVLLVPKKSNTQENKWRLVVDFRQLNKKITPDKFPLPRIDEILDN